MPDQKFTAAADKLHETWPLLMAGGYEEDVAQVVIAAVEPLIREQIAEDIEALARSASWFAEYEDALNDAAKIARGGDQ